MALLAAGCAEVSHTLVLSDELVVYVGDRPYPSDFDPPTTTNLKWIAENLHMGT